MVAKGVRNTSGISFQKYNNQYIKYIVNVGQDLVESVFAFTNYRSIPVTELVQHSVINQEGFVNFGWRAWEGAFATSMRKICSTNSDLNEKVIVYYDEAIKTSPYRLEPLTSSFHDDNRSDKYKATALTGVQPYMGHEIPDLTGSIIFSDLVRSGENKGVLAYTKGGIDHPNDFSVIEVDHDFGTESAFYICLGANINQSKLYLGVYGSMKVNDFNQGSIFEIIS